MRILETIRKNRLGKRWSERGRSMVEMLGVLAIIGVLSLTAVAGYKWALTKHRANEIIHETNLRTTDLMIQFSKGLPLDLSEWSATTPSGYAFSLPELLENGFTLGINDIPQEVCRHVFDGIKPLTLRIDINGEEATDAEACTEQNDMLFYFLGKDPKQEEPEIEPESACDPACRGEQKCVEGECVCENGGYGEDCSLTSCSSDTDCDTCHTCKNGKCQNVPDATVCATETDVEGRCLSGTCLPKTCQGLPDNTTCLMDNVTTGTCYNNICWPHCDNPKTPEGSWCLSVNNIMGECLENICKECNFDHGHIRGYPMPKRGYYCDLNTWTIVPCPSDKQDFQSETNTCIQCLEHRNCPEGQRCNQYTYTCENKRACSYHEVKNVYDETTGECRTCLTDAECQESRMKDYNGLSYPTDVYCNIFIDEGVVMNEYNACVECPKDKPSWNAEKRECYAQECTSDAQCGHSQLCIENSCKNIQFTARQVTYNGKTETWYMSIGQLFETKNETDRACKSIQKNPADADSIFARKEELLKAYPIRGVYVLGGSTYLLWNDIQKVNPEDTSKAYYFRPRVYALCK